MSKGAGVKEKEVAYIPKFPETHELLMQAYDIAMTYRSDDENKIKVVLMQANGVLETLKSLKNDGVLPEMFVKTFHEDITNVMKVVHAKIELNDLTDGQSAFTFGMAALQSIFGGR